MEQNKGPEQYTFSAPLTQAIVSTLGSLPWNQVHQLMVAITAEIGQQEATYRKRPPEPELEPSPK